jgi:galactitol-specific phosphotransferase system IIC component
MISNGIWNRITSVVEMMTRAIEIAKSVIISRMMMMTICPDRLNSLVNDNVDINHVAPPLSSSLINVVPVGALADLSKFPRGGKRTCTATARAQEKGGQTARSYLLSFGSPLDLG